ncbi:hypothetical protein PVAP13_1KG340605 [Panicum virgatum]|uniref:PB1 domain-containing protein n=1 Tax=Panicum virgatum TaxID=38727 RepID=A0A8T0XJS4_PANVG|nr:hypothetical protein PVAP13_1KG340605 [Panicum virgatum]
MDGNSCFKLEIRIVAPNCRGSWYSLDKFVDADFTNFKDLVDEVVDKCPPSYGHIVKIFYSCMDSKANIEICSDQDLVEMFAKHKASKCCYLTFCYHSPSTKPPKIPIWDVSGIGQPVEAPFTPSMPCPSIAEPSLQTHSQCVETEKMPNPEPCSEFQCDGEGLYIDIGPQNSEHDNPHSQQKLLETSQSDRSYDSNESDESSSDEEDELEDIDDIIKDSLPAQKPDANYGRNDPPMAVKRNTYPHDECHSTRRAGAFIDWLKEDENLETTELRKKLKENHKTDVIYRKVYLGKQLAMDKIYGPCNKSFDNLYRFKVQIEEKLS